jgi:3-oxoacyl-[acyl-carrier-protein] synthase-1
MPQDNSQSIYITEVAASTPVGLTIEQTAASIRAGIAGFKEFSAYMPMVNEFDVGEEAIQVAAHEFADSFDWKHLSGLLSNPLAQLIEKSRLNRNELAGGGFFLSLPLNDQVVEKAIPPRKFLRGINERMALPAFKKLGGAQSGATGVYTLIQRAIREMQAGEISFCVIAAVDSYLLDGRLALYDEGWRLKTKRNPAGFIPGEAAAVLLLETEAFAQRRNRPLTLRIDGVHLGQEANTILGSRSSSGSGLTNAIRPLAEVINGNKPCRWVYSDLNGEAYKAYEWGVTLTRLHEIIAKDHHLSLTADAIGDVGAATAAVQIGCIVEAIRRGYARDSSALLLAGNDTGKRAAMAVSRAI